MSREFKIDDSVSLITDEQYRLGDDAQTLLKNGYTIQDRFRVIAINPRYIFLEAGRMSNNNNGIQGWWVLMDDMVYHPIIEIGGE